MKQFIKKTIYLGLPILLFLMVLEVVLRQIPNDYKTKANFLNTYSNTLESLILGSSHSFYGLNPEFFTSNTYNASHVSQSLDIDFQILKKYENNLSNLKTVYLPVSYYTLWFKLSESNEYWRTRSYIDSYGLTKDQTYTDYLKITGNFKQNILKTSSFLFSDKHFITISEKGWGTLYSSEKAQDLEKTGFGAAQRHTKEIKSEVNQILLNKNLKSLNNIIDWCESRNVKLVIFTAPGYKSYRDELDPVQLETTISILTKMALTNKSVSYYNFLSDSNFKSIDFYDGDHLSDIGAEKLSKIINKFGHN